MTKLTKRTYFTAKNKYISNSKIGDWLKDKRFFYEKHVLGTVEKKDSAAFRIGSAVDTFVTVGEKQFHEKYIPVARRSKEQPNGIIELLKTRPGLDAFEMAGELNLPTLDVISAADELAEEGLINISGEAG